MKTIESYYKTIVDYPKEGILYRDVTSVLADGEGLQLAIDAMLKCVDADEVDAFLGIEARGFFFAPVMAYQLRKPFIPVRKAGKLPRETLQASYELEYGQASLELHQADITKGMRVVIVDDLIATGGTAKATADMVEQAGGIVVGFVFLSELTYLEGRKKLSGYHVQSVVQF